MKIIFRSLIRPQFVNFRQVSETEAIDIGHEKIWIHAGQLWQIRTKELTPGFWFGMGSEWALRVLPTSLSGGTSRDGLVLAAKAGPGRRSLDNRRAAVICRNVALLDFSEIRT